MRRWCTGAAAALCLGLALAPSAGAAEHFHTPATVDTVPPGFHTSARQAFQAAERTQAVRDATRRVGRLQAGINYDEHGAWRVQYAGADRGGDQAEIEVDGRTGKVLRVWTGARLSDIARGRYSRLGGDHGASLLVLVVLGILFALPFVDPRRLWRQVHLDVGLLLAFLVPFALWREQHLKAAYIVVFALLVLVVARLALARPRPDSTDGPLVPFFSARMLIGMALALLAARLALNVIDADTSDIGRGTLAGAHRLLHGQEIYSRGGGEFDTYGPAAYALYAPFAALWPLKSIGAANPFGAHAAALFFDAATAVGLFFAGRRFAGGGARGQMAGAAAAYGWVAYPFTTLTLAINANDAIVSLSVLVVAVALFSPVRAGAGVAVSAATKFAPLALLPLSAAVSSTRRPRGLAGFAIAFALTAGVLFAITLPDGGLREVYDVTVGLQAGRDSPLSFWYALDVPALKTATMALVALFVGGLFLVRLPVGKARFCALGAAALFATQLPLSYWFFPYLVWPLPLALLALVARRD
ncbi:MAG: hypothetical protein QOH13_1579 [Thermoleophilaceae bacterium]|nr:hypothetical protein [Thermoleophilaceae bacterium]